MTDKEKRKFQRVSTTYAGTCAPADHSDQKDNIVITDLSPVGVSFYSSLTYQVGQTINFSINFTSDTKISFTAVVVHIKELKAARKFKLGCKFVNLPEDIEEKLKRFYIRKHYNK